MQPEDRFFMTGFLGITVAMLWLALDKLDKIINLVTELLQR